MLSSNAALAVAGQFIIAAKKDLCRESKWAQLIPLFTGYGITASLLIPLLVGMTLIVRPPMADSITELCKKFKPNHIVWGPAIWEKFADDNKKLNLEYFIMPTTGGDELHPNVEKKINTYLEKCGSPYLLMNGYGMTEVGAGVALNFRHIYEFDSVGTPFIKSIISAFDVETGEELTYGQEGELCIHTPSMMMGYINAPEENANIIRTHSDGLLWVHSGDLGYVTENGFVHISGRLKRYMIYNKGGIYKKIFSFDIEKQLLLHPDIANCEVVPIPDAETEQAPVAFVILKQSVSITSAETAIQKYAEEVLDPIYCPVKYYFVEKFPLTKVSKVDYRALETLAAERGDRGAVLLS